MNETTHTELGQQVVDLGDAKEMTMGFPYPIRQEENPVSTYGFEE